MKHHAAAVFDDLALRVMSNNSTGSCADPPCGVAGAQARGHTMIGQELQRMMAW